MIRALAALLLSLAAVAPALAAEAGRAEVPIREATLSDGTRRYAVPVTMGGLALEAGLDTGSSGLRVLPNVLSAGQAHATAKRDDYSFGAGARFEGVIGETTVAIGELSGPVRIQLVQNVGCTRERPRCAAGRVPLESYGVQGDGLPGEGFKAILGAAMGPADVDNPLQATGARRWVIDLPRPGEAAGRLILNPTDEELAGFVRLPLAAAFSGQAGGLHDAVHGCLQNETTGGSVCGAVTLDTGAPGLRVATPEAPPAAWPERTPARISFADRSGRVLAIEHLMVGSQAQASRLSIEPRPGAPMPIVFAGLSPYFAFSVLYDPEHGEIGLKPRAPAPGGPRGAAAAP